MAYLDAVYENNDVIFNAFPMDVVGFLLQTPELVRQDYRVIRGEDLSQRTAEQYLEFMKD